MIQPMNARPLQAIWPRIRVVDANGFADKLLLSKKIHQVIAWHPKFQRPTAIGKRIGRNHFYIRSEEHTSELQSLMRISYAVFCLKQQNNQHKCNTERENR